MTTGTSACIRRARLLAGAAIALAFGAAGPAGAAELALKRAVLGLGGVGYFEYAAEVEGAGPLRLRARLEQVDDILKSLVVIDPAGAASLSLPGKTAADQAFASLPFEQADLETLPALMQALKGARVTVEAPRKLAGTILSATKETATDKSGTERSQTRVALLSGVSVEQFVLEEAQGLAFEDARLGQQVDSALAALRAARDRSGRDIAINLASGGKRTVRLGYVAEAPVWKVAYRLSLPKGDGKARLQGWAVLENMTGADWKDVALTLTSGAPVTFRQALYEPYHVTRPVVPPPVPRIALPRVDEGSMPLLEARAEDAAQPTRRKAAAPVLAPQTFGNVSARLSADAPAAPPPPPLGAVAQSADAAETLLGASFSLTAPVQAKAGESLSVPFLDAEIAATDSAWVQSGQSGRHPWRAVKLANAGASTLPAGAVTLYESAEAGPLFVGEAQLAALPPGQDRLLAFGQDGRVTIDRDRADQQIVSEIAIARGTMTVTRVVRQATTYRIANADAAARAVVLDHPRLEGARLIAPAPDKATIAGQAWRMTQGVEPGKTVAFEVVVERPLSQTIAISDASRRAILQGLAPGFRGEVTRENFVAALSGARLEPAAIERLQKIADASDALVELDRKLAASEKEREAIFADQERIRANLGSVAATSDFGRSLVQKLQQQEKRLDALAAEKAATQTAREGAQKTLDDLIGRAGETSRFSGQAKF